MRVRAPEVWPYSKDLYTMANAFAQGYDRRLAEAADLLTQSPEQDGQPRGSGTSDPTPAAAIRRERVRNELDIIERALLRVGEEYRAAIVDNVCRKIPLARIKDTEYTSLRTWTRQRIKFLAGIVELNGWEASEE